MSSRARQVCRCIIAAPTYSKMPPSSHPHHLLFSFSSFYNRLTPSHVSGRGRRTALGRREQWTLLVGLILGIGITTIVQTMFLLRASRAPTPNDDDAAAASLPRQSRPRALRSFFSFASSSSSSSGSSTPTGKRPKLLLFGDSLTQRGFEGPGQGWAAGVAHAYGRRADVVNRGFSGYTAKWCALMLPTLFPADDPAWEVPLLAVVFLGANDAALPSREQHVPVHEYEQYLSRIVAYLQKRRRADGARTQILLLTPPPVDEDRWEAHCLARGRELDRKNEVTRLYARACLGVGKTMNVPVVDVWTQLGGSDLAEVAPNLRDGLHLSPQGNVLVCDAVLRTIEQNYPGLAPEELPMQAPEHFEVTSNTTSIEVA